MNLYLKKIKQNIMLYIFSYISFVYDNYIYQDWDCVNKISKNILYPFWIIRTFYAIIFSILFFPIVLLHMESKKEKYRIKIEEMFKFSNYIVEQFLTDFKLIKK